MAGGVREAEQYRFVLFGRIHDDGSLVRLTHAEAMRELNAKVPSHSVFEAWEHRYRYEVRAFALKELFLTDRARFLSAAGVPPYDGPNDGRLASLCVASATHDLYGEG